MFLRIFGPLPITKPCIASLSFSSFCPPLEVPKAGYRSVSMLHSRSCGRRAQGGSMGGRTARWCNPLTSGWCAGTQWRYTSRMVVSRSPVISECIFSTSESIPSRVARCARQQTGPLQIFPAPIATGPQRHHCPAYLLCFYLYPSNRFHEVLYAGGVADP